MAQDAQYSQFYNARMYQNPAFTGSDRMHSIGLNHRSQWPGLPGSYTTSMVSYDAWLSKQRIGLGGYVIRDVAGVSQLASTSGNLVGSYTLRLSEGLRFAAGFQAGVVNRNNSFYSLTFESDFEDAIGPRGVDPVLANGVNRTYFDLGLGGLLYSRYFWFGGSVHHLTMPNQGVIEGQDANLPMRITLHFMGNFPLVDVRRFEYDKINYILYPVLQYRKQGPYDQFDGGAYVFINPMVFGVTYRGLPIKQYFPGIFNQDALSFMFGWQYENLRFAYSYDYNLSRVMANISGSHEISVQVLVPYPPERKKVRYRPIPCPKFD